MIKSTKNGFTQTENNEGSTKITKLQQLISQLEAKRIREKRLAKFKTSNKRNESKISVDFDEIDILLSSKLDDVNIESDEMIPCRICKTRMSNKVIKLHEAMCYINEKILDKHEPK